MPRYKKKLGQHHLRSAAVCRPMVDFLEVEGRRVVEIGPGGGVLTGALLDAGARVLACEVDLEWAFALRARFCGPRLAIAAADALDLRWEALGAGSVIAGNLPYNVATPLILGMLPLAPRVERAAVMVQLEVGRRLVAAPGTSDYGSLSVLVAAWSRPRMLAKVPAAAFRPRPRVDGAIVGLRLAAPPLPVAEMPAFAATVRAAFARRRKTLRNALAASHGRAAAAAALERLGWPPTTRAESLDLAAFLRLHKALEATSL